MTVQPPGAPPAPPVTARGPAAAEAAAQAADEAAGAAVVRAEDDNLELVRFLYADHGGIIRGKAATRQFLAERITSGIGHTVAMMAMSMLDQLPPGPGMSPVGGGRPGPAPG